MKYLIVSGGEVKEGFLTWIVKNGGFDVILAADAGMEALYRDHILPDIIVGDFDSVNPDTLEYFHDKEQIEVFYLPSYSPDLNPDERLNADLKYALGSRVQTRTKDKLKEAKKAHMDLLEAQPERVRSYFNDPRVKYAA